MALMRRHDKAFGVVFGFLGGISETTQHCRAAADYLLPRIACRPDAGAGDEHFILRRQGLQFATLAPSGIATIEHWLITLPLAVLATVTSLFAPGCAAASMVHLPDLDAPHAARDGDRAAGAGGLPLRAHMKKAGLRRLFG